MPIIKTLGEHEQFLFLVGHRVDYVVGHAPCAVVVVST